MTGPAGRAVIGGIAALAIVLLARRRHALSTSGATAALILGVLTAAAGWAPAVLLVAFFITGTFFSRMASGRKARNTSGVVFKGGERDYIQVLANGGAFTILSLIGLVSGDPAWSIAAVGAIAASTSDTWATEVGTAASGTARSLIGFVKVQAGTSGAITARGTLAAFAGASFIAGVALLTGSDARAACAALAGGIGGSLVDSVLGATVQSQRWCGQCGVSTERMTHTCGNSTNHLRGVRWLDNDHVNALASVAGAAFGFVAAG